MSEIILLVIFAFLLAYYLVFLSDIFIGLGRLKKIDETRIIPEYISIIIPFRDERENLPENLRTLKEQNYPKDKFEIIYVNDFSTDDSVEVLKKNKDSDNIKIISVPENFSPNAHKKRAIRFGIENAKGEIIVTSDADCTYDRDWLRSLLNYLDAETAFVSGPVVFEDIGKIFGRLQKIEFAGLVIAGAGLIGINKPAICNAANIAYRKKIFEEVEGFSDHLNLSSGDDELLMQKIWKETKYKIKFCLDKNAVVKTAPNISINQFYQQRKRWASKGLFYASKLLIIKLILIFLFYSGLAAQLMFGIFFSVKFLWLLLISLFLKALTEYFVLKRGTKLLFEKGILKPFIFAEILHIPYIIIAGISGIFGNFTWKERKVAR